MGGERRGRAQELMTRPQACEKDRRGRPSRSARQSVYLPNHDAYRGPPGIRDLAPKSLGRPKTRGASSLVEKREPYSRTLDTHRPLRIICPSPRHHRSERLDRLHLHEGPLWHPDGSITSSTLRANKLYRSRRPEARAVRETRRSTHHVRSKGRVIHSSTTRARDRLHPAARSNHPGATWAAFQQSHASVPLGRASSSPIPTARALFEREIPPPEASTIAGT